MWATTNMQWGICVLFTPLTNRHPVWHYTPLLFCGRSRTSIRQGCLLRLALSCCDKPPSRKCSIIYARICRILQHPSILNTTSKNSHSYCHCAIAKWMMLYMGVYVYQTFESRLQVNPIESPHFCLISVFVSTCQCLSLSVKRSLLVPCPTWAGEFVKIFQNGVDSPGFRPQNSRPHFRFA